MQWHKRHELGLEQLLRDPSEVLKRQFCCIIWRDLRWAPILTAFLGAPSASGTPPSMRGCAIQLCLFLLKLPLALLSSFCVHFICALDGNHLSCCCMHMFQHASFVIDYIYTIVSCYNYVLAFAYSFTNRMQ